MKLSVSIVILLISLSFNAQIHDQSWGNMIKSSDADWFASKEAQEIAENVLLYQREIGGWPKNIQMHHPLSPERKTQLKNLKSNPIGATTDNNASTQEMLFLSKMYRAVPDERYKIAFLKGLYYLLEAQYENGGWPQFYPLKKSYYSRITYNDNSMVNILNALKEIKDETNYFSIKPSQNTLKKVKIAFDKGIECILKTQYRQNGTLTAWCAQHDEVTLEPRKGRAYELASLSAGESAGIVHLLMRIEQPSQQIINAVKAAVEWFDSVKITGLRQERIHSDDRDRRDKIIMADPNAHPIWARFMDLEDNSPIFVDRDGVRKSALSELSWERRNGYAWYGEWPRELLKNYSSWKDRIETSTDHDKQNGHYIVVAHDGSGDYTTIQAAINNAKAFPYERITIFVKNGVYKEKIKVHEWNTKISLVGESREGTIITFDDYFNKVGLGRNSTFYTYTLLVEADDFVAKNLTIENSAGEVGQAVALSVVSDRVAIINCKLLGNQDTLYASGSGRQYYKDCYIEGTTDFIFGSATAVFEDCEIHSKKNSYITAASTPKDSLFGYVFKNCKLTSDDGVARVYLGRPWRIYAKTVFINCDLGSHILPEGWHNWSKPEAETTVFYAEFENRGEGFHPDKRVPWSRQLSSAEAGEYTLENILGGGKISKKQDWYENY